MVASLSALKSTNAAASYYRQVDDYYRSDDMSPTQWSGRGAESLRLRGEVDAKVFTELLRGRLPDGEQLGRPDGTGGIEHRPGWDLTFSAPKSVSALGLAGNDDRLIRAHEHAVATALAHVESEGAAHQMHGQSPVASQNLLIAQFRHATNREQQPQLHSHCVILNATQDVDGRWRSLESRPLYRLQKEAGLIYRSELARHCRELGYTIEHTKVGKEPGFEIKGVPAALLTHWSERSRQIEAALDARGETRDSASAASKEMAALGSRARKTEIDHAMLREQWHETAKAFGADLDRHIEQARECSKFTLTATRAHARDTAQDAVAFASEKLAERDARFSKRDLLAEARKAAFGKVSEHDLRAAIQAAEASGELVHRQSRGYDPITGHRTKVAGYTTPQAVATERTLLATAQRMIGTATSICHPEAVHFAIATLERQIGYSFNQSQRTTTLGLLTSFDRLQLVQGYAGTAKTTSVLAATAAELIRQGQVVRALAPTASAAQTLATAIGVEGATVAGHLLSQERSREAATRQTWIVDEASLLSARDMSRLLTQAERIQAQVILVGDVKQLGSVDAGSAFRQLQEQTKLKTHVLDQIVRQRNAHALSAVQASIRGDAREALHAIERAGVVQSHAKRAERVNSLVSDYMAHSPDQRQHSLVIALGRDDRQEINGAIRVAMHDRGELCGPTVTANVLVSKDLTRVEMKRADCYVVGDIVRFGRDYQRLGVDKGSYATVTGVDVERNRLSIKTETGHFATYTPRTHAKTECFLLESREIQVGEQLRLTRNDRDHGRINGQQLIVERIDGTQISVRDEQGRMQSLDTAVLRDSHLEHAYCSTAHAAQGKTAERVFVHAESFRTNLANQQSFYVAVSRAQDEVRIYTDDRERLIGQIERESGEKSMALAHSVSVGENLRNSDYSMREHGQAELFSRRERDQDLVLG